MRRVLRLPFSRARLAHEINDELAFHLEQRVEQLAARGMTREDARREALRQFGDVESIRRSCVALDEQRERTRSRMQIFNDIRQDLAYTVRALRRNVAFTALVVGALAVGIGANTAIFTLVDAVLVRALPVSHPEQLVVVGDPSAVNSSWSGSPRTDILSAPVYRDVRAQNHVFSGVLATGRAGRLDARIAAGGGLEHPSGRFVSGNYFSVLGIRAAAGRTFDASADSVRGASPVVTISYGYWTRRFQNDPAAIGSRIVIDDVPFTIVGVAQRGYTGEIVGQATDIWIPLEMHDLMQPHDRVLDTTMQSWLLLIGRLKSGVTIAQAREEIPALVVRSTVSHTPPKVSAGFTADKPKAYVSSAERGLSRVRDDFEAPLLTLMIGVALLLCIICVNVANLLMARAIARGREMAVRLALGANRARLVRQLLTESAVLALASAGAGLLVAWETSRFLVAMAADGSRIAVNLQLDARVLAFTVVTSVVAVALFGLAPALRAARVDLAGSMRSGAASVTGGIMGRGAGRFPLGRTLIVAQVALSIVLLVGATLLGRSLSATENVDTGLDRDHLVVIDLDIGTRGYVGAPLYDLAHTLRDELARIPGVAAVTFSENGLFSGTDSQTSVEVPGFTASTPTDSMISYDNVGAGYARGIGARLLQGRDLDAGDENKPARVALVNESLAAFYFPHQSAIGRYVHFSDTVAVRIVGVIADTRDHRLVPLAGPDRAARKPERRLYFPYVHTDTGSHQLGNPCCLSMLVRTESDPSALVAAIRRTVSAAAPMVPISEIDPLTTRMRQSIRQERLLTHVATAFGMLALVLAAIGLYGVMTYAVTRRTGEIGLRVALGAAQEDIVRLVLVDALRLMAAGLLVGVPLALALTRLLQAQLHGVQAADPVSLATALIVLAASGFIAVALPAFRAARVAPTLALRDS